MEPKSAQTERPSAGMPHLIRAAYRGQWFSSFSSRRGAKLEQLRHIATENTTSPLRMQRRDHRDNEPLWSPRRTLSCLMQIGFGTRMIAGEAHGAGTIGLRGRHIAARLCRAAETAPWL